MEFGHFVAHYDVGIVGLLAVGAVGRENAEHLAVFGYIVGIPVEFKGFEVLACCEFFFLEFIDVRYRIYEVASGGHGYVVCHTAGFVVAQWWNGCFFGRQTVVDVFLVLDRGGIDGETVGHRARFGCSASAQYRIFAQERPLAVENHHPQLVDVLYACAGIATGGSIFIVGTAFEVDIGFIAILHRYIDRRLGAVYNRHFIA